jgi:hypothetical protein
MERTTIAPGGEFPYSDALHQLGRAQATDSSADSSDKHPSPTSRPHGLTSPQRPRHHRCGRGGNPHASNSFARDSVANKPVFDSVIVITDRNILDTQLQEAIRQIDRTPGIVAHIAGLGGAKSQELADARAERRSSSSLSRRFLLPWS